MLICSCVWFHPKRLISVVEMSIFPVQTRLFLLIWSINLLWVWHMLGYKIVFVSAQMSFSLKLVHLSYFLFICAFLLFVVNYVFSSVNWLLIVETCLFLVHNIFSLLIYTFLLFVVCWIFCLLIDLWCMWGVFFSWIRAYFVFRTLI